ncbi:AraC-type DNA-binding protein [Fodinibius roseus]|uniref:AraC-type DNA-binding protein n=1 Tax=Fodinibius roseus TaxID=1194090 RepID=A0A1M5EPF9_9BACT|nr:helix-turn-helix domain-containing protein [Fodinibius roseus]SHF80991.1 AraC-type DNA-binding protein [Fodinibius roseus]
MSKAESGKKKGGRYLNDREKKFDLSRITPSDELQFFIEHFWIVEWDPERPLYKQQIPADLSVQLIFEKNNTWIWGVATGMFKRPLKGKGKIVGIKFRPGGFYPFFRSSVSTITDGILAFDEVFGEDISRLEKEILTPDSNQKSIARAARFLENNLPEKDERVKKINDIIDTVIKNSRLIRIEQLVERLDMSRRSLRRLFKWYVGIPPEWIIKRSRLHEVANMIAEEQQGMDWTELALKLGYADQSYFIKDFKSVVGETPIEYARSIKMS